jgi:transcriptional regulator with XRE-family HTH domain
MHSHLAKMLGQSIIDSRRKSKISQKKLAQMLDVSAQFLGRIEKGDVMIPDPLLLKAIDELDLPQNKIISIFRAAAGISANQLFEKLNSKNKKKKA